MKTGTSVKCAYPGCGNLGRFEYDSVKDRRDPTAIKNRNKWTCSIHTRMEDRLTPSDTKKEKIMQCMPAKSGGNGVYFDGWNGRLSGPGFWVLSEDFPVGTKLIVTAEIILPKEETRKV